MQATLSLYYRLTKPGIVYGNVFHAAVGLLIAHRFGLHVEPAVGLLVGTALVIASACVANNLMDRSIDARMTRTKKRGLVTGEVTTQSAVVYLSILFALGAGILAWTTNWLTLGLALVAYVWYVWIYGWAKRTTWLSTIIGTVPGSLPIMAGYTALSGSIDMVAWVLFAMLTLWQMPHFYAIALYRQQEYATATLPVISVALGRRATYHQMLIFAMLYVMSLGVLIACGGIHIVPGFLLVGYGLWWLLTIYRGRQDIADQWAKKVFRQSLIITLLLFVAAGVNLFVS